MKRLIYFLKNGKSTEQDDKHKDKLTTEGWKVFYSNGSFAEGFEDSCEAVALAGDFPHIEEWAKDNKIKVVSLEDPKPAPKPASKKAPAAKQKGDK